MDQRDIIRLPVQYFAEGDPAEADAGAQQPEGKPGETGPSCSKNLKPI